MGALSDLWKSERGILAVLLVIAATVLTAVGKLPASDWKTYTMWIFGIYSAAKTTTGVVAMRTTPIASIPTATALGS